MQAYLRWTWFLRFIFHLWALFLYPQDLNVIFLISGRLCSAWSCTAEARAAEAEWGSSATVLADSSAFRRSRRRRRHGNSSLSAFAGEASPHRETNPLHVPPASLRTNPRRTVWSPIPLTERRFATTKNRRASRRKWNWLALPAITRKIVSVTEAEDIMMRRASQLPAHSARA